eukprot:SAG31_NODE_31542_length_367_cov_0.574627_1_plen_89_part_10
MSTGGADSVGIDRDNTDVLGTTNELRIPKQTGGSLRGRGYEWSSIFPSPRVGQRHHGDIHDLLCELRGAGQSGSLCMASTSDYYGKADC